MTNQEAIKEIQERIDTCEKWYQNVVSEYHDALVMAIAALEKQEPMEVNYDEQTKVKAFDGDQGVLTYNCITCPKCQKWISIGGAKGNYCEYCGQALSWKGNTNEA